MSTALRFTRIKVQNVGVIGERAVEFDQLSPGVNVISGPNECGKSSIVRALKAAMFQRHASGHQLIKALQPYGTRLSPEVEVDFELDGAGYQLVKRFLKKGMSRVSARDGSMELEGDEADQWLFERLGAREPQKKGVNSDDMGVWGLLWVNQDASATEQPSEVMGDHVRGSLARTIGALVGDVMGGEHGVALKRAIDAEHDQHWTAKTREATGRYNAAIRRVEELELTLKSLRERQDATAALGDQIQQHEEGIEGLEAEREALRARLAECERAAREGELIERRRDELALACEAADELCERAEAASVARSEQRERIRVVDEALATRAALAAARREEQQRRRAILDAAAQSEKSARADAATLLEALEAVRRRLDATRAREELGRLEARLAEARRLEGELREAKAGRRTLPDEAELDALVQLDRQRVEHDDHIARHATRVVVTGGEHEGSVVVPTRRRVVLGGLGSLTIDPPREGFLAAREAWRELRGRLLARLEGLRVESVSAARAIASEHQRLSTALDALREKRNLLAPRGFDALSDECQRAEQAAFELSRKRDELLSLRDDRARVEQELAAVTLNPAELQELNELDGRIRALEALEARASVSVSIRPLADVRVQLGAREPPRVLSAGVELRRPIAAHTTITVEDTLLIEIDPGGLSSASGLDDARLALSARLAELELGSLDDARRLAQSRTILEAKRAQIDESMRAIAAQGVDALVERAARAEQAAEALRRRRVEARAVEEGIAKHEHERGGLGVRAGDFSELDELDRGCLAAEQRARRLAGRVLAAEGALQAEIEGREDLVDTLAIALEGALIEVVPGEVAHDVALPILQRELASKLKGFGLGSLDDARRAHYEWVRLNEVVEDRARSLDRLAPKGVSAIDGEVARARLRLDDGPVGEASREELERELDVAKQRYDMQSHRCAEFSARVEAGRVEEQLASRGAELAEGERQEHAVRQRLLADELRAAESVMTDAALQGAAASARAELTAAQARYEEAARACDEALPELRRADYARAQESLAEVSRQLDARRTAMAHDRGVLNARLEDGYHDKLSAVESELLAAQEDLARIERDAGAVRLLREAAQRAYGEAQLALMEPVSREAMPLLQAIRPGTTFRMNRETMQLEQVLRGGLEEEFKDLSGGAREQLAIVVRIALAKVFARENRALPLVLDDILGWTDDRRLRAMLHVIERTSHDLQVLLLTCHPSRFRGLAGARSFALDEMRAGA